MTKEDLEARVKIQDVMLKRQERMLQALRKAFSELTEIVQRLNDQLHELRIADADTVMEECPRCKGTKRIEINDYTLIPCPDCK